MPYAAKDRQELIRRSGINPDNKDNRVLDFGGMLSEELPSAIAGISSPRHIIGAVIMEPRHLPFKDSVFDDVLSYHYFDLIPQEMLGLVFSEVARILNAKSVFSFMITLWNPQNESQRSNVFFHELLKSTGALHQHDFENINKQLYLSGFSEITVEIIKREITVPEEYVRQRMKMLGALIKKEKKEGGSGIRTLAKQYFTSVEENGEAMLPAIHFIAKK